METCVDKLHQNVLTYRPAGFHPRATRLRLLRLSIAGGGRLLRAENGLLIEQDGYPRRESPNTHLPTMRAVGLDDCVWIHVDKTHESCPSGSSMGPSQTPQVLIDIVVLTRTPEAEK